MRTAYQAAFTLIELLVVLSIISLLLTISLPRYFGSVNMSKEVVLVENLRALRRGIDNYCADTGNYPTTLEELVTHHYLRAVPHDPMTESASTWVLTESLDSAKPGVADVHSGAKGKTHAGVPYHEL